MVEEEKLRFECKRLSTMDIGLRLFPQLVRFDIRSHSSALGNRNLGMYLHLLTTKHSNSQSSRQTPPLSAHLFVITISEVRKLLSVFPLASRD